jgi:hypothetical protein
MTKKRKKSVFARLKSMNDKMKKSVKRMPNVLDTRVK